MAKVYDSPQSLGERTLQMKYFSSMFKGAVVLGSLAMVCHAPVGAAKKLPAGLPVHRAFQNSTKAAQPDPSSAQNPQAGESQGPNTQMQSSSVAAEHVATKPPQVTYENGQLNIIAENSSLADVMSALRAAIGADIDLPAGSASQRIWVRLGPGPARKVLRDLLESTELNFVIQASETDEDGVRSVVLTARSKNADTSGPGSNVARGANRRPQPTVASSVETPEPDGSAPSESARVSDAATELPSPERTGAQSAASNQQSMPAGSESSLSRQVAMTPDQRIQQLQSMYEQRRQMQMQQNRKPPGTN